MVNFSDRGDTQEQTSFDIRNHYSPSCPGCAFAPYRTHQHAPYRFHVTSKSRAGQNWYHLVELNDPRHAESFLNKCDCEWGSRREYAIKAHGEVSKPCIHILQAKAEYDRLHMPRTVETEGEELFAGEEVAALAESKRRFRLEDFFGR